MEAWQKLGEHSYRIERDLLRWRSAGLLAPGQVDGMLALIAAVNQQNGYCLMLAPAGERQQSPEVRRALVQFFRQNPDVRISVGLYGSGVLMRAAVMLVLGALHAGGTMRRIRLTFFDCPRVAEAWLDAERQRWQATADA